MHECSYNKSDSITSISVRDNVKSIIRIRPFPVPISSNVTNSNIQNSMIATFPELKEVQVHSSSLSAFATEKMYIENGRKLLQSSGSLSGVKRFTYDGVFPASSEQRHIFDNVGAPVVQQVLNGYNATILSYGQTGSGKTYTMMGPNGGDPEVLCDPKMRSSLGLVPRILDNLFQRLESQNGTKIEGAGKDGASLHDRRLSSMDNRENNSVSNYNNISAEVETTVTIGVAELYNEILRDLVTKDNCTSDLSNKTPQQQLLSLASSGTDLRIREARGQGVYIEGLTHHVVTSAKAAMQIVQIASRRKSMGTTKMNETSSRSHTIIIIQVSSVDHVRHDTKTKGEMFLVDLAGSERVDKTGSQGERLKEAQHINLSLTLLGNVISKLTDKKSLHIPYRDAKLTRLLQDSLGGNSLTTLICTCSPEEQHIQESISSLQFAQRAKSIHNQPVANVTRSSEELLKEIGALKEEIMIVNEKLRMYQALCSNSLEDKEGRLTPLSCTSDASSNSLDVLKETILSLMNEITGLKEDLKLANSEKANLSEMVEFHKNREEHVSKELKDALLDSERNKAAADAAIAKLSDLLNRTELPNSSSSANVVQEHVTEQLIQCSMPANTNKQLRSLRPPTAPENIGIRNIRNGMIPLKSKITSSSAPRRRIPLDTVNISLMKCKDNSGISMECVSNTPTPDGIELLHVAEDKLANVKVEALWLVKERQLMNQLEKLKKDLDKHLKYAIIVDRQVREIEDMKKQHECKMENARENYDRLLVAQDQQIGDLMAELAKVKAKPSVPNNESETGVCSDVNEEKPKDGKKKKKVTNKTPVVDDKLVAMSELMERLENENKELHSENQTNAVRMIEFTKKIDQLETAKRELQDDREQMRKDINFHTMEDGELKRKLLAALNKGRNDVLHERAYFRKRLLDCFV